VSLSKEINIEHNSLTTYNIADVIDQCIELYQETNFEDAHDLWIKYSSNRDKERLFIEYFKIKPLEWVNENNLIIVGFINLNHRAYYLRALAYFGYKAEIVQVILFEKPAAYIALFENYFERFGEEAFFNFLKFLLQNGITRINGPHNILEFPSVIILNDSDKKKILKKLIDIGIDIYKRRTKEQKLLDISGVKITDEDLKQDNFFTMLGLSDLYQGKLKIIRAIEENSSPKLFALFKESDLPKHALDKIIINYVQNIDSHFKDWDLLLGAFPNKNNVNIPKYSPIAIYLEIGLKAKKFNKEFVILKLNELVTTTKKSFMSINSIEAPEGLFFDHYSSMGYIRRRTWSDEGEIKDFITLYLQLNNKKIDYSILNYFNSYFNSETRYTEIFSDFIDNEYFINGIDYYEGIQGAIEANDVDRALVLYNRVLNLPNILDERHHYIILKSAVDRNDHLLYNEVLRNMGAEESQSSWILSRKCEYLINNRRFLDVEKTIMDFYLDNHSIRDEEVVSLARVFPISKLEICERIIYGLSNLGYKVPSKAIHSLAERMPLKANEIQELINKYESIVGDDICFTELELMFSYISLNREPEAREIAVNILKRNLNKDFREHVSRLLDRPNWNINDESILALKFEFGSETQIDLKVRRKYSKPSEGLVRNNLIVKEVKKLYNDKCQVCRQTLNTPLGSISEAAHIQGLGSPHYGPDEIGNILCLCPNHHKLLDNSGIFININLEVIETLTGNKISDLLLDSEHKIHEDCLAYQRNYCINAVHKKQRIWT
jgi:hypothetical protein